MAVGASGLADDAITWTKGEVLGKGAYGIVSTAGHVIKDRWG